MMVNIGIGLCALVVLAFCLGVWKVIHDLKAGPSE
jgi:hypothetical protein